MSNWPVRQEGLPDHPEDWPLVAGTTRVSPLNLTYLIRAPFFNLITLSVQFFGLPHCYLFPCSWLRFFVLYNLNVVALAGKWSRWKKKRICCSFTLAFSSNTFSGALNKIKCNMYQQNNFKLKFKLNLINTNH